MGLGWILLHRPHNHLQILLILLLLFPRTARLLALDAFFLDLLKADDVIVGVLAGVDDCLILF